MQIGNQNIPESFRIREPEALYEMQMQALWDKLPNGTRLTLTDNSRMKVVSRGEWNREAGPDFRNAALEIHGKLLHGDIELHRKSSDYIRHGHAADSAYSGVILHVVAEDDLAGSTGSPAAHLPVFRMKPETFAGNVSGSCDCRIFPYLDEERLRAFFTDAGMERLREKAAETLGNMISGGAEYAFRERLFRFAGSKQNRDSFLELLKRFEQYSPEARSRHFKAVLWGESGLLPDPASEKLPPENAGEAKSLWNEFWPLRREARPDIPWRRDSVRPANSPERRIALLCVFLEKFTLNPLPGFVSALKRQSPGQFIRTTGKALLLSDPFWDSRWSFRSRPLEKRVSVLGAERAATLLTDVIAPSLLAHAELHSDGSLGKKARELFLFLPAQPDNRVVKNALKRWFPPGARNPALFQNAAMGQGCLHIYKKYCAKKAGDCSSCLLADS
ncbi:MAG: hypothetical protein BWY31_01000 [Lentisphaerae bacterium ADurb.Bin242]|nr:MAG: hypothetical protein BWY31_01000 [Lentisphaerae bacterium ADurb.Bin242]